MHIRQGDGAVLGMPGRGAFRHRLGGQDAVDALQGIGNNHLVFAHVHDFRQRQGDNRGDDDVKQQIQ